MQLGRNCYRRLKSLKYDIYELYPSARRAYYLANLAVKTKSTPLYKRTNFKCYIKISNFLFMLSRKRIQNKSANIGLKPIYLLSNLTTKGVPK